MFRIAKAEHETGVTLPIDGELVKEHIAEMLVPWTKAVATSSLG